MKNLNVLLSNYKLTTSGTLYVTPEIEVEGGELIDFDVLVESISGGPSAASLAAKFQVAPIEYNGFNMNTDVTSGVQRPWIDVVAADTFTGHLLTDGAWPTTLADQTLAAHRLVNRRLRVPALARLVRLALTPTYTGGTAPAFRVTVASSCEQ